MFRSGIVPTYEFRDKDTGEIHEKFLSFSGKDQYLLENPHLEQTMTQAPGLVSGVSGSKQNRVPDGFKEVLSKISESHRGSNLAEKHTSKSIKEAKTAEVVRKHVERVTKRNAK